jgi:hypothetical protein
MDCCGVANSCVVSLVALTVYIVRCEYQFRKMRKKV